MIENDDEDVKNPAAANIKLAIVLGLIALIVGLMPFFYLKDMAVPG